MSNHYRAVPERPINPTGRGRLGRSPDGLGRYGLAAKDHDLPLTGQPPPQDAWPYDMYPGQQNTRAWDMYGNTRGRFLAGVEPTITSTTSQADGPGVREATLRDAGERQGMKDYPEELDRLQQVEDVQGNGIFDPFGSHGNLNPDDGIFQDRANLPGYLAREKMFQPSEVIDLTTGQPVVYVPGTPFMLDPRTPDALKELELYEPGWPGTGGRDLRERSTWVPDEPSLAINSIGRYSRRGVGQSTDEPAPASNMFLLAAAAGISIGLFAALAMPKKRRL